MKSGKATEVSMLARFQVGEVLLGPLIIQNVLLENGLRDTGADARLDAEAFGERFRFVVESKCRSTPEIIQSAIRSAKRSVRSHEHPLIQVPYLAPAQLKEMESAEVSGVDLCGNGVVVIPGRFYILRTGFKNLYPDSRPLSNPFSGRSAMVGRILLREPQWEALSDLRKAVAEAGENLSLSQVSKAIDALKEEMIVSKTRASIKLIDPAQLIDRLGREWTPAPRPDRLAIRIRNQDWAKALSSDESLQWAVTGESSVVRYAMFSQSGPKRLAVSNLLLAKQLIGGIDEPIPSFSDIDLIETNIPGYYFDNAIDENGVRWASRLQTWLELQVGDARQREVAADIRNQLMKGNEV